MHAGYKYSLQEIVLESDVKKRADTELCVLKVSCPVLTDTALVLT